MFSNSTAQRAHTIGRSLARELTPAECALVGGGSGTITTTCSDQTVTDCETDTDCQKDH